jgi:hypothetical protein
MVYSFLYTSIEGTSSAESFRCRQRPGRRPAWAHDQKRSSMFVGGYHLQVLSLMTRLCSRHQLYHVLRGGIAAILSLPLFHLNANKINPINARNATHSGAASDTNSPKVHRRESCLATFQIKPVSPPMHAAILCLLYVSGDVASPFLPP